MATCRNPNHPCKGSTIKVEPIRTRTALRQFRSLLANHPRNSCLFIMGINTGFRASDLLSITNGQVRGLRPGDELEVKEKKTGKYRRISLNTTTLKAIRRLLTYQSDEDTAPLFYGQRGPLTVPVVSQMVKGWARTIGLEGNYASHSLRKTWGYHQRVYFKTPLPVLMEAFGHANQRQTLDYLCIQPREIRRVYQNEI